jgi:hypothetical protein
MMSDLPKPPTGVKTKTYADDVTVYTTAKNADKAEQILQPHLNRLYKWGKKWGVEFQAEKSTLLTFSRSRKNPQNLLLFIHGRRIPPSTTTKFLGVHFDRKLSWKTHINEVVSRCQKKKNLFNILIHHKQSPSIHTLATLYKTIVRSQIDYGILAYGGASTSTLSKIDVTTRSILRQILGSARSTPTEILYSELGLEPTKIRMHWLAARYLIKLSYKPTHSNYQQAQHHFLHPLTWPPRSIPCLTTLIKDLKTLNYSNSLFTVSPNYTNQLKPPPPWAVPPLQIALVPYEKS